MDAHRDAACVRTIDRGLFPSDTLDYATVLLRGAPRTGKSVALAQYSLALEERHGCLPVYYAVDMDTECHNPTVMLNYICYRFSEALGRDWQNIDDRISDEKLIFGTKIKVNDSLIELERRLAELCAECRNCGLHPVILIDAPESLAGDRYRSKLLMANEHATLIVAAGEEVAYSCGLGVTCRSYTADEAIRVIDTYFRSEAKEIHESVWELLLVQSRTSDGFHSVGWLALTLYWLTNLDAKDFAGMAELDYDSEESKIEQYMLGFIESLPIDEDRMLIDFAAHTGRMFNSVLVGRAMTALALSPYGIEERELAMLVGDQWDPLLFADFRRWLVPFISESPALRSWHLKSRSLKESLTAIYSDEKAEFYDRMIRILQALPKADPVRKRDLPYYAMAADDFALCASLMASPSDTTGEYFVLAMNGMPKARILEIAKGIIAMADERQRPAAAVFLILMLLLRNGILPMKSIIDLAISSSRGLDPALYGYNEYALTCLSVLWSELSFITKYHGTADDSVYASEMLLNIGRIKYRCFPSFDSKQSLYKGLTAMASFYMESGQYEQCMALYNEIAELSKAD